MTSRIDKTIARQREKWDFAFWTRANHHADSPLSELRIAAGAFYEAHQQLRVIAARYIKASNWDAAADLLAGGATALLKAGAQQGASASGGDLAIMLVVEVYNKAEWEIAGGTDDAQGWSRKSECFMRHSGSMWLQVVIYEDPLLTTVSMTERLIELLREFPSEEPTRKRYIQEIIGWSSRYGPLERGDPDLHHAAGSVYAEGSFLVPTLVDSHLI